MNFVSYGIPNMSVCIDLVRMIWNSSGQKGDTFQWNWEGWILNYLAGNSGYYCSILFTYEAAKIIKRKYSV